MVIFFFGFFVDQVAINRSNAYNMHMPKIAYWVLLVCLLIIPWAIIILAIMEQIIELGLHPYFFFVAMSQLGLFCQSLQIRGYLEAILERSTDKQIAYTVLRERCMGLSSDNFVEG